MSLRAVSQGEEAAKPASSDSQRSLADVGSSQVSILPYAHRGSAILNFCHHFCPVP